MEKLKEYKYLILIGLLVLGFAFYWFEYRPTAIIKECSKIKLLSGLSNFGINETAKEINYKNCLRNKGLVR